VRQAGSEASRQAGKLTKALLTPLLLLFERALNEKVVIVNVLHSITEFMDWMITAIRKFNFGSNSIHSASNTLKQS
jgi:hypothetical protein